MNQKRITILYFIQLPPPVHGVSTINELVYNSSLINEHIRKELLEIKFSNSLSQLRKWRPGKILKFIRLLFILVIKILRKRPDYIYFSIMPAGRGFIRDLFFVLVIRILKILPIYHIHNRGIQKKSELRIYLWLYRFVFNNSMVIHLSENLMETEIKELDLRNCICTVIPNGIPEIETGLTRTRKDEKIRLLFLSNLFAWKGLDDLLMVFSNLLKKYPQMELVIAGDFPTVKEKRRILKLISGHGITGKVNLCGPVYGEMKYRTYQDADIFVFPTYFSQECFPLVILEAMQSGLPVVATREGAIPEIITDGVTGFTVTSRDTASLEQKISLLIESPGLRKTIGNEARKMVRQRYLSIHLEQKMRAFYDAHLY